MIRKVVQPRVPKSSRGYCVALLRAKPCPRKGEAACESMARTWADSAAASREVRRAVRRDGWHAVRKEIADGTNA